MIHLVNKEVHYIIPFVNMLVWDWVLHVLFLFFLFLLVVPVCCDICCIAECFGWSLLWRGNCSGAMGEPHHRPKGLSSPSNSLARFARTLYPESTALRFSITLKSKYHQEKKKSRFKSFSCAQ